MAKLPDDVDVRQLRHDNIEELSELTGHSVACIRGWYDEAVAKNQVPYVLIMPATDSCRDRRLEKCVYDAKWTEESGWIIKCITHGKPSYHAGKAYFDGSQPCIEVDPYYPNGEMG